MEAGADQIRLLAAVFGESSDSDAGESHEFDLDRDSSQSTFNGVKATKWEAVEGIKGLWIYREFLSEEQQPSLMSAIEGEGWLNNKSHNQAMRFGDLPEWAVELTRLIREIVCFGEILSLESGNYIAEDGFTEEASPLPTDLLWREPLFDQLIVNVYQPGEGIAAHVDLMRFEDGIAIVSLESECVMHFTRVEQETHTESTPSKNATSPSVPLLLSPGSLVLISGDARYLWKHEINRKPGFQLWKGREIQQQRRISVTLRKLCR